MHAEPDEFPDFTDAFPAPAPSFAALDEALDTALEDSFPASDPLPALRFA